MIVKKLTNYERNEYLPKKVKEEYYSKKYYVNHFREILKDLLSKYYYAPKHTELKTSIITSINNTPHREIDESDYNKDIKDNIVLRYVRYENHLEGYLIITNWNND